ncbi:hypothetical protein COO91_07560 [Nostoc flagelliforme CCNUN1]|uniref:Uncharacterized protein n=1 Tax=Nostoc flagelliforme CCNUN1 TaxID=2038116 RepID=A0A2K8T1E2_9NOSO|nr:hypothetical protein [Nostoc flagelliforme]AUB41512.1 hypothetical protein COO91_07560 [Nostoc flagelliforme CCNUN1]
MFQAWNTELIPILYEDAVIVQERTAKYAKYAKKLRDLAQLHK